MSVTVVGAGVIGLSCAIRLAESGHEVEIVAAESPVDTTSAVAGALWLPYRAEPADRVARWGRHSLVELTALAERDAECGVYLRTGTLIYREPSAWPSWADEVAELAGLHEVSDPAPGYPHGLRMRVPLVDMSRYLTYLVDRFGRAGGRLSRTVLTELPRQGVVVNATGLAAGSLVDDAEVYPVRGQTVVLANPGLTEWFADDEEHDEEMCYVLPRAHDVVVGGSAAVGDWTREPDPALAERILDRARRIVPALVDAPVLAHRVGLRPGRSVVRLEAEPGPEGTAVHCYGHGGAGVTLSWGCADEVAALVDAVSG